MLGLILALLLDTGVSAHALGADSWRVREAASARLAGLVPVSLPALALASCSQEPEASRRAARLLAPWGLMAERASDRLLLAWLLHQPGYDWPSDELALWLEREPPERLARLESLAREQGYLDESYGCYEYGEWGWVCRARQAARLR